MPERTLQHRLQAENSLLAPYAVPHQGVLGRAVPEEDDTTRSPFQRDRGRILHSQAFRRLQGKTQVFVVGEGDHYRTRLTHTLEVAQISRDIARTLGLNEDVAECVALAHDLGHPPFGHAGEESIDTWLQQFHKRFEHNQQTYRILTVLEEHSKRFPGLNVNREILDGVLKHQSAHDQNSKVFKGQTLEAQLVNIADEIAYSAHDSDDGLRAGLFTLDEILDVPLAQQAYQHTKEKETSLRGGIIDILANDLYQTSTQRLQEEGTSTLDDVYAANTLIGLSDSMNRQLAELRSFLWQNMYLHTSVLEKSEEGKQLVQQVLDGLYQQPNDKIRTQLTKTDGALEDAVKDYVAGMTERFASQYAQTT